jgi:signal peptidase I
MAERRTSTTREYLEALLIAGIFLGFSNTFVVKTFYIPSASMEDTLLIGDHLFVNRFVYGPSRLSWLQALLPRRAVERGDVVIFRSPEAPHQDLVKRCVATGGDRVEVVEKELYINGRWVEDGSYTKHLDPRFDPRRDRFGPVTVPDGSYLCLGDNRDRSHDSRFWGPLPREMVKGRAFLIYWSYGGETSDGVWRGWGVKLRQLLGTASGFFTRTRWSRTFEVIR